MNSPVLSVNFILYIDVSPLCLIKGLLKLTYLLYLK